MFWALAREACPEFHPEAISSLCRQMLQGKVCEIPYLYCKELLETSSDIVSCPFYQDHVLYQGKCASPERWFLSKNNFVVDRNTISLDWSLLSRNDFVACARDFDLKVTVAYPGT